MATLKLKFFAAMKDYFEEDLEISLSEPNLVELRKDLVSRSPGTQELLSSCRFAVNDNFVNQNHVFSENDLVLVLPPSSGG
ncbi:MAG TPA: MoaD/ThiS family protein [Cytophagaceae bacterium]|jgi:molybdopterin synthase sulfur carrier subunit